MFRLTPGFLCGSEPRGDAGFDSLASLGVRTVVSVDGSTPDLERARARGMRYVHLPIGYDGVARGRALNLLYALRELNGPVYLHCHKGIHRGPAAAALAMTAMGRMTPDAAVAFMHRAGTAEIYAGLFEAVRTAGSSDWNIPADFAPELPECAARSSMTLAMVEIETTWQRVESCRMADWQTPGEHPDVDPVNVCVILMEHFREAARLPDATSRPLDFAQRMSRSAHVAKLLSEAVAAKSTDREPLFRSIRDDCTACHEAYRNHAR